jgi:hypothetical protein
MFLDVLNSLELGRALRCHDFPKDSIKIQRTNLGIEKAFCWAQKLTITLQLISSKAVAESAYCFN